jgi:RecA/RadA recombinase
MTTKNTKTNTKTAKPMKKPTIPMLDVLDIIHTYCSQSSQDSTRGRIKRKLRRDFIPNELLGLWDFVRDYETEKGACPTLVHISRDPDVPEKLKNVLDPYLKQMRKTLDYKEISKPLENLQKNFRDKIIYEVSEKSSSLAAANKRAKIPAEWERGLVTLASNGKASDDLLYGSKFEKAIRLVSKRTQESVEAENEYVKTGWPSYDNETGGFGRGSLVIISATVSSGKSTAAMTLGRNVNKEYMTPERRGRVLYTSLELSHAEMINNYISCCTGIPLKHIKFGNMSKKERMKVDKLSTRIHRDNGCFDVLVPKQEIGVHDIFDQYSGRNYDMIIIDQATLLRHVYGLKDRQDQMYSDMAKLCKQKASELNCVVILLTQLNEKDPKFALYSQGFKQHANVMMQWECTEENRNDPRGGRISVNFQNGKIRSDDKGISLELSTQFYKQQMNDVTGVDYGEQYRSDIVAAKRMSVLEDEK